MRIETEHRFDGDLQGPENWRTQHDALDPLREVGIATECTTIPCSRGYAFDAWDKRYDVAGSQTPHGEQVK